MEAIISETLSFDRYKNSVYFCSACPIVKSVNYPVPFHTNCQLVILSYKCGNFLQHFFLDDRDMCVFGGVTYHEE
jgi:hypothetical protein